jgi:MoaA/NifB/PqqE/SkfB family radical SAM enzyme
MFALRDCHQIEMTSRCNLRCRYCPSPHLKRPKMDMSEDHYIAALAWAHRYVERGSQHELNLAGIGESTLHPDFVRWVFLAREAVGPACRLVLATNGLTMTDELAMALAPSGINVYVSLHRPEKAGPAVECLKRAGILSGVSLDPSVAATDWAGQVKWHNSAQRRDCTWVRGGKFIVLADGRVSRCAFDASGIGVICSITDELDRFRTTPYALCVTCDQDVGVPIPEEYRHEREVVQANA